MNPLEFLLQIGEKRGRSYPVAVLASPRLYASDAGILLSDTNLRLVVLNSYRGARNEVQRLFSSTASLLAGEGWGIPTVLAMQFSITNAAALVLAHEFYRALVDNIPVDAACPSTLIMAAKSPF